MVALADAVAAALVSWQSNYTIGDDRWRVKQLHQLYLLLLDNRDELIASVSRAQSTLPEVYERELALLVKELDIHISNVGVPQQKRHVESSQVGEAEIFDRPVGVSLIISGAENPFRFMLAPLAASIAAGNVTILAANAATGPNQQFLSLLSRVWNKYLDRDNNLLVTTFEISDVIADQVDLVTIYDIKSHHYDSILSCPNARIFNTSTGSNIALITEGKKDWRLIARDIANVCRNGQAMWSDRLHVVFTRPEDYGDLQRALAEANIGRSSQVFLDATLQAHVEIDLAAHLETARKTLSLLIVQVLSMERAVDAMICCSGPIQQLAILGQQGESIATFSQNWLTVKVISVGFIYPIALLDLDSSTSSPSSTAALVSSTTFSRHQVRAKKPPAHIPMSANDIRGMYRNLIAPLKPEPRGERIGFFTQAEYLLKGVGATVGLLTLAGMYYGIRWAQRSR